MVQAVQFKNAKMETSRILQLKVGQQKMMKLRREGKIPLAACLPDPRDPQTGTKFGEN